MSGLRGSQTAEVRQWNRMSEHMNGFHNFFRQEFDAVYELADGSFNSRRMSVREFLRMASDLVTHLNFHHSIEERHIFPVLAQRMPEFKSEAKHIESHRAIHHGLDELSALVTRYSREPSSYSPVEMKACLDGFRKVLFDHLDEEVYDLRADNLQKYYTLQEVNRLPM